MSLPTNKAEARALDTKCASFHSAVSKRIAAQLEKQNQEYKVDFLTRSTMWDLGNLVRCALEAKISADTKTDEQFGVSPMLVVAAFHGSLRALKALGAGGANLELPDRAGGTALAWASREGQLACLLFLIEAGANPNAQDELGNTPLFEAVANKRVECARVLLPISDLKLVTRKGRTAFHSAADLASEECFEMLLPLMSDVDVRTLPGVDEHGEAEPCCNLTALHLACDKGQQLMCKALVKRGASRMARDSLQRIPLHWAAFSGHLSCILLLVGRPGKVLMTPEEVDAVDAKGWTPLHLAAFGGFDKICGVLIQAGARLDTKTRFGDTPLMLAQRDHPTNAALLMLLSSGSFGPAQPLPGTVCDHCGKTAEQASVKLLKVCGNCHGARFCNAACQTAAWPGHKAACKARVKEREEATKLRIVER